MQKKNKQNKQTMPAQPEKKAGFGNKKLEGENRPAEQQKDT